MRFARQPMHGDERGHKCHWSFLAGMHRRVTDQGGPDHDAKPDCSTPAHQPTSPPAHQHTSTQHTTARPLNRAESLAARRRHIGGRWSECRCPLGHKECSGSTERAEQPSVICPLQNTINAASSWEQSGSAGNVQAQVQWADSVTGAHLSVLW
ncbi:hypothetical protein M3J07_009972 [Ascochyta lentis]